MKDAYTSTDINIGREIMLTVYQAVQNAYCVSSRLNQTAMPCRWVDN